MIGTLAAGLLIGVLPMTFADSAPAPQSPHASVAATKSQLCGATQFVEDIAFVAPHRLHRLAHC